MNRLDKQFWRRFLALAAPYWVGEKKWQALGLVAVILALTFSENWASVGMSFALKDYMTALTNRDAAVFTGNLCTYMGLNTVCIFIGVFNDWVMQRLLLSWRGWLTFRFLDNYFANRNYYALSFSPQVDNPDERLHEDINSFTESAINVPWLFINSLIRALTFIAILWSISPVLVVIALVYGILSSAAAVWLGQRRLLPLDFNQRKVEADFRYHLIQIRDNTESIAFYRGQDWELESLQHRFQKVIENFLRLIAWRRNMGLINSLYEFVPLIIPALILSPHYCKGSIVFGVVGQGAGAFQTVSSSIGVLIKRFWLISELAAVVNRLGQFSETVSALSKRRAAPGETIAYETAPRLLVNDVTVTTPNKRQCLINDLSFSLDPAGRLLIVGPSGAGKSSLLRTISGLWTDGKGRVARPDSKKMLFLPQRPYMLLGSLRDQLLYSVTERVVQDDELLNALGRVNLADLPARFGGLEATLNWAEVLSPGEQQRLAFARLLLAKPDYAILDESTSALDVENEASLYALLQETPTAYLSVGHRGTLLEFHDRVLALRGDKSWSLLPAAQPASLTNAGSEPPVLQGGQEGMSDGR